MRAGERVDHDLLRGRGVLGDRETETEDPISVPVEKSVEGGHLAEARGVDKLAIGSRLGSARRVSGRFHCPSATVTSGRYRRVARSRRSPPS